MLCQNLTERLFISLELVLILVIWLKGTGFNVLCFFRRQSQGCAQLLECITCNDRNTATRRRENLLHLLLILIERVLLFLPFLFALRTQSFGHFPNPLRHIQKSFITIAVTCDRFPVRRECLQLTEGCSRPIHGS